MYSQALKPVLDSRKTRCTCKFKIFELSKGNQKGAQSSSRLHREAGSDCYVTYHQAFLDNFHFIIIGERPNIEKIAFLITDGEQNPKQDKTTNEIFDPIASSKKLHDRGRRVKLFFFYFCILF